MWLLAGMGPRVNGQGTTLDKALVAVGHGTVVWPLIGMNAVVSTQVRLAIERLLTPGEESDSV